MKNIWWDLPRDMAVTPKEHGCLTALVFVGVLLFAGGIVWLS